MGFSTLLDILGSTIVGGMLFLILLKLNDASVQNTYVYGGDLIVQQDLVAVVDLIEYDFRKIGYCKDWTKIPDPSKSILAATDSSITYLTDDNNDGIVDTMRYFTGPVSELSGTPNPRDRLLYRVLNSDTPKSANMGITEFKMSYFDALGNIISFPITTPSAIYTIQIDITIENSSAYNQQYSSVFWRQIRLAARNLRNR